MKAYDAIRMTLDSSSRIMETFIGDLTDADLMVRALPGMNHIAWQIGHLLSTEYRLMEGIKPSVSPGLPAGFEAAHAKDRASSDDAKSFKTKKEYLDLYKAQRNATLQILESLSESDLDKPAPEKFKNWAPTFGAMLNAAGTHLLMHVGQFVAVRRKLNKPVVM